MICPRCQQSVRDGARFCDSCGLSIGSIASANQAAEALAETLKVVDPLIGHVIDAKYKLIEQLGKGGMGVVYRAERVLVGDEVALKILRGELVAEEESVERFRREARAAAKLRHPNIVTIYDYGEARGADAPAYIVMELLDGESLREVLLREGRLKPERAIQLMRGICAGIGLAHRRQIVHRDIKPDNMILLPPDEEEGREHETVKVVDFGIAKLRDAAIGGTLTRKGFQPGTVFYMSPEQCRGDALDARSDVYSLGALLYEMLAGTPPFVAESHMGVISKHLFDPPSPFPGEWNVPPLLEAVVMRALAKQPDSRPADAGALARELQDTVRQEREVRERENEERQRVAAEQTQNEEARQREDETRHRSQEQPRDTSETLSSPTVPSTKPDTGPQPRLETDPEIAQAPTVKSAFQTIGSTEATDPVPAAGLRHQRVGTTRGMSKIWISLGGIISIALIFGVSLNLFRSNISSDTASPANTSLPLATPHTVALSFKPIGNPLKTQRDIFKVALSPDGKTLISTGSSSSSPPSELIANFFDIDGSSLAFSPDGKLLAVGQEDGSIIVKDSIDLSHKLELHEDKDYVFQVAFTADSSKLISASADKSVRVWNLSTGKPERQMRIQANMLIITIDSRHLRVATFHPGVGPYDGVTIRSITDPAEQSGPPNRPTDVTFGAFSPNGDLLALGQSDGEVGVWSIPDHTFINVYQGPVRGEVGSGAFSPDGQLLAIGWNNGDIELRRASDGTSLQTLKGHTRVVRSLSFSRDGHILASGAEDKTIRLWQNGK